MNPGLVHFHQFPLSTELVLMFLGYMHVKGYAPSTMLTYNSAISYPHKLKGVQDPTSSFAVQKLLAGATKVKPDSDSRLPINLSILHNLSVALLQTVSSPYLRILFRAMYLTSFFALMRVGEVTSNSVESTALFLDQLKFQDNYAIIVISKFKHNLNRQPFELVLVPQTDEKICPIRALQGYINARGRCNGPLFCLPDLKPVSREIFLTNLKHTLSFCGLDPTLYKSHSFRIGGASYYAELGLSDEQIRLIGRWKSNAFRKYIRCQRMLLAVS